MRQSLLTYTPARSSTPLALTAVAVACIALGADTAFAAGEVSVTVRRRSVTISGDALGNQVNLAYDAGSGELTVTAEDGTTLAGDANPLVVDLGNRDIVVSLGAGADSVVLRGGAPRGVRLLGGEDDDFLSVGSGEYARGMTLDGGPGSNNCLLEDARVGRRFRMLGGDEVDTISVRNSELMGPATVDGRDGGDFIDFFNTTTLRPTQMRGGEGNDYFGTGPTNLHRSSITFNFGAGDDELDFGKSKLRSAVPYGGKLRVIGGAGRDSVFGFTALDLSKGALVNLGADDDFMEVSGWNGTRSIRVLGGSGNDDVSFFRSFPDGPLAILGGPGDDSLRMDGGAARSITVNGAAGADFMEIQNTRIRGAVRLLGGSDGDTLDANGVTTDGKFLAIAGSGDDQALINDITAPSGLLNGGGGEDTLTQKTLSDFDRDPRRPGWELVDDQGC